MTSFQKAGLLILIIGTIFYIKTAFFTNPSPKMEVPSVEEQTKTPESNEDVPVAKSYVTIYFIGQNSNKDDVYKIVKREYDKEKDGSKLSFALSELVKGPTVAEKSRGIYSEIPSGTKILAVSKNDGKVSVDLSQDFELGGGTDGLYKRLYQLIKTVNKNTSENVYLKIEGREVDVIGGEGIMITQPLTQNSLDG